MYGCTQVGAVVESYHVQGWHTMHAKSFCEIYDLKAHKDVWKETCARLPRKLTRSRAHAPAPAQTDTRSRAN